MKHAWIYAVFAICVLSPYLTTGYYQDDSINSLFPTYLKEHGLTPVQFIWDGIRHWVVNEARLFPLTLALGYSVWAWIQDLLTYRILHLAFVLSNLFLFIQLIQALGGGKRLALLAGMIVLALFQLRDFHDPIASYAFMMQISMAFGTASLLFMRKYADTSKPWAVYASLGFYACAILHYEIGLVFLPLLWVVGGVKKTWRHSLATGFYLATVAALRALHPVVYAGIQSKWSLKGLGTFAYQLSAALPLSYPIFGRSGFYRAKTLVSSEFLSWPALAIWIAGVALFLAILKKPREEIAPGDRRTIRFFAWGLTVLPAALVAMSQKYQDQVTRPGIGYLPVYLSCFGVALLFALGVDRAKSPKKLAVLFAFLIAFTFSTNRIAADRLNQYWKYPRERLEQALRGGLVSSVPEGALIVLNSRYDWASPDFFLHHSGKRMKATFAEAYATEPRPPGEIAYRWDERSLTQISPRIVTETPKPGK